MKKLVLTLFVSLSLLATVMPQTKTKSVNNNFTPEWSKNVVWYQIFPERFRNGDISNDPTVNDIDGSYPHDVTSPFQTHPWGADWFEIQPYERLNGKNIDFQLQRRRYGGDIQGIISKLDYIQSLGITAIYLNPIFFAPSSHKYDAVCLHHIDPTLGDDPEGDKDIIALEDFNDPTTWKWTSADKLALKLIAEVHKRGMRIIFDGVFNHMGMASIPFKDVKQNGINSKYKDWFKIKSFEDKAKGTKFEYDGWYGVKELPELKQDENGLTEKPKNYIFNITKKWMDPEGNGNISKGIDGWRLDVAFCVKHPFWKSWRTHVKSINKEAYLTAEVIDKPEVCAEYLQGDEFDAVMNYNFAFTSAEFFFEEKVSTKPSEFDKRLSDLRNQFPTCVTYVQQNLFGSHDANRVGSAIVNKSIGHYRNWGEYFNLSQSNNSNYNTRKPSSADLEIQKLFVLFQMTYVGAPMVYYGDEVGMWGANDPDCRKPMIWDDITYDPERFDHQGNLYHTIDSVEVNNELLSYYKKMIAIRNSSDALRIGNFTTLITNDNDNIYAYSREHKTEKVIVVLNNSNAVKTVTLATEGPGRFTNLPDSKEYKPINGKLSITVPAKSGLILSNK